MTVTFYAQPYDISATGFYFTNQQSYRENISKRRLSPTYSLPS
jgi:hypothetical protein